MTTFNAQQNSGFLTTLKTHPILMGALWGGLFIVLVGLSYALDIVPKLDTNGSEPSVVLAAATSTDDILPTAEIPTRIIIERLGVDAPIENPDTTDDTTLNDALLSGVVHYPGSGNLEESSNMFFFGHSTGFRIVNNEAYKSFNGLKNAQEGDLIRVRSTSKEHVYRVTKVMLVDADAAFVSIEHTKKMLTLSTCNVFGQKQERYVVEAEFVGQYDLVGQEG